MQYFDTEEEAEKHNKKNRFPGEYEAVEKDCGKFTLEKIK